MSSRGLGADLRAVDITASASSSSPPSPPSPAATRQPPNRWRDPRLVVGAALVAGCGLLGARLTDAADHSAGVWVARHPLTAGQPLTRADLVRRQVGFAEQATADRYLSSEAGLSDGVTLDRPVGAGELVPRAALAATSGGHLTEVPLSVPADAVPATVGVGSVVDVWVTPEDGPVAKRSTLVFPAVPVVAAPRSGTSLGPSATRQVIVGVGDGQLTRLPESLASLAGGDVTLTARR